MNANCEKFVDFKYWCERCKYSNKAECEEPCNDCLSNPVNVESTRPVYWSKQKNSQK